MSALCESSLSLVRAQRPRDDELDFILPSLPRKHTQKSDTMEEDRAQGNLGIAADLPENEEPVVQRFPKKRFIGRRQAAELALNGPSADPNVAPSIENSMQGMSSLVFASATSN